MKDILKRIADNKRKEIEALFPYVSDISLKDLGDRLPEVHSMRESILKSPGGIISEFKRRSPSKGEICPMGDVSEIVREYKDNGASAISVLTDTVFFGGSVADLAVARGISANVPLLRKDFIISKVQIAEARRYGASAVLLIAAILSDDELSELNDYAHSLNLEALVEIHNLKELDKIKFLPDMLGVNNRNLNSFHTDVNHSFEIAEKLPSGTILVAESGIKTPEDIKRLRDKGFQGFLIGEAFMSTPNPGATLSCFIKESL